MSHQQLSPTAPAFLVAKEPSLPFVTHCHRNVLNRLGRAFTECLAPGNTDCEGKTGASYVIRSFLAGI